MSSNRIALHSAHNEVRTSPEADPTAQGQSIIDDNCTRMDTVRALIENSLSENSRRAYQSDIARFEAWGGMIPCTPDLVAEYLAAHAQSHKAATLMRWIASLSTAHRVAGLDSPTSAEVVRATLRGIKRTYGTAQREARPLVRDDLFQVLSHMGSRPKDLRDKALLLVGFAGAFRRSELVGLDVTDLEHVRHGLTLTLRHSKTDQDGNGRKIGIPFGRFRWCPVKALEDWLVAAPIAKGPIFRPIDRHSRVIVSRLSGEAVSLVIRERITSAGLDPAGYSGHSLRAGLATSAALAGVPSRKIRQQTGHASDAMLNRYIRDGNLFQENAASAVL